MPPPVARSRPGGRPARRRGDARGSAGVADRAEAGQVDGGDARARSARSAQSERSARPPRTASSPKRPAQRAATSIAPRSARPGARADGRGHGAGPSASAGSSITPASSPRQPAWETPTAGRRRAPARPARSRRRTRRARAPALRVQGVAARRGAPERNAPGAAPRSVDVAECTCRRTWCARVAADGAQGRQRFSRTRVRSSPERGRD